jgi:tetratricopeptide (TPR) repeat protein
MADDSESTAHGAATSPGPALSLGTASAVKADAYLDEQIIVAKVQAEVLRLQAADLRREDRVRHWSLRVHHVSDVLKLCLELAAAVVVAAIAIFIGASVWAAMHDNGVVIEAFDVPTDFAQRGLTGKVVASQLLDRLQAMQAATSAERPAATYANNWGDDIAVQIPETGISVAEFNRYLHRWLGNQTIITGELYRTANGISVTTRFGNANAVYVGGEAELGKLLQKSAEAVYAQTQPYRFSQFLLAHGRMPEATRILSRLAVDGPDTEKGWANAQLGELALNVRGDIKAARAHLQKALGFGNGSDILAYVYLINTELWSGQDEMVLKASRLIEEKAQTKAPDVTEGFFEANRLIANGYLAGQLGDFQKSAAELSRLGAVENLYGAEPAATADSYVLDHDPSAAKNEIASFGTSNDTPFLTTDADEGWKSLPVYWIAVAHGDWRGALADARASDAWLVAHTPEHRVLGLMRPVLVEPLEALAVAKSGDETGAEALIGRTARDCYLCLRVRGRIAAEKRDWKSAAAWFADADRQAPSLPFAETDWGAMLLRKGDFDGAIAKFALANQKGPHFADPMEMWGGALIAKNRSDLAVAKFEEANKYAPNWGRLHLKWGEALLWSGKRDEAKKQFAAAGHLDLTPSEKSELARMAHG